MKEDLVLIEAFSFIFNKQSHLVYECKVGSFSFNNKNISKWDQQVLLIVQIIIA